MGAAAESTPVVPMHAVLAQKNKMFEPHMLVVTRGSTVEFPNRDPWFHNVFSLFNGKRFDLGLYEAGTSRTVHFDREGVSFIFCNIHPEMSAVVIALSTPLYATADATGAFTIPNVPEGDYELHAWVEGVSQTTLDHLTRRIHVRAGRGDLGALQIPAVPSPPAGHLNKFGQPYGKESKDTY
jgi:plastocyanin